MTNPRGKIVKTLVENDSVEVTLDNGVKLIICSNMVSSGKCYINVHLSNVNLFAENGGGPVAVSNKAANQFDIDYIPHKD